MPRKTHADRLLEMGAISTKVHSMLKTEEQRRKDAKAQDAARIAAGAIAKAMRPNEKVTGPPASSASPGGLPSSATDTKEER